MVPPIAMPSLTLTVTPPGGAPVSYAANLAWAGANQSPTITQNFGRQGDTATLPLVEDFGTGTPHVAVLAESQISLYDNIAAVNLFSGVVTAPTQCVINPTMNEWDLACVDYTLYADNADVHGVFYGWTVDQIIISLTVQAGCGITAVSVANGGFVEPGPQLASYVLNQNPLSTAWRQLAALAGGATPYGWFVDQNLELHFFDASTAQSSGVTFTTVPTVGGSLTEGHIAPDSQNSLTQDATSLANKILVQGANQPHPGGSPSTAAPTDTWVGNGAQSAWPLRFTVSGTPILYVGGVAQAVTVAQAGAAVAGAWVVAQNSVGAWFLLAANAPGAGVSLEIWYTYLTPVIAQAQDLSSQAQFTGPNSGVFERFVSDSSLTTPPMALARAQQMRTEYAFPVQRVVFNTSPDFLGWVRAGWTCAINNTLLYDPQSRSWGGIADQFIITANTITFGNGGYRTMAITAVRI